MINSCTSLSANGGIYTRKLTTQQLHAAIAALPDKQAKRVYAHYILGVSKTENARAEDVDEKAVRGAIERALKNMEHFPRFF